MESVDVVRKIKRLYLVFTNEKATLWQRLPNTKASTVMAVVRENVKIGTVLLTDEYRSYQRESEAGYMHDTVRHGAKEYVRGKVHTNTVEGFWSQLKRSMDGTHHSVSAKHLQKYLNEHVWRWNLRASSEPLFYQLLQRV
ncbi:IS1595 family transposase [bacterium]|nr:IS1595 family transposase [bacterium]